MLTRLLHNEKEGSSHELNLTGFLESFATYKWRHQVLYAADGRVGGGLIECGNHMSWPREIAKLFLPSSAVVPCFNECWTSSVNGSTSPSSGAANKRKRMETTKTIIVLGKRNDAWDWVVGWGSRDAHDVQNFVVFLSYLGDLLPISNFLPGENCPISKGKGDPQIDDALLVFVLSVRGWFEKSFFFCPLFSIVAPLLESVPSVCYCYWGWSRISVCCDFVCVCGPLPFSVIVAFCLYGVSLC